jgi:hypothetical protein
VLDVDIDEPDGLASITAASRLEIP